MSWRSENRGQRTEDRRRNTICVRPSSVLRLPSSGFTLVETMAAVALLTFIGASVWLVLERCMVLAADTVQRNRAFEIARENMENLIGLAAVEETTEYGESEQYPDIRWQTTVESFYENNSSRMWVRAVASAEYTDTQGETQSVSFTHWLTDLSDEQMQMLIDSKQQREKLLSDHIIETEELASEYAGVNVETIREWVRNGMPMFDGAYLKPWLELYNLYDGNPPEQQKLGLIKLYPELAKPKTEEPQPAETPPAQPDGEESPPDAAKPPDTGLGVVSPPPMPSN